MVFWTMAAPVRRPSEENSLIEFLPGIPAYLDNSQFIDPSERNLMIFDDLMTEAKCDQRIATFLQNAVTTEIYLSCI